jgi:hypothetical protein
MDSNLHTNRSRKITFRLNEGEARFLDGFCKDVGVPRSDVIRRLVRKIQGNPQIIKTDQLLKSLSELAAEQGRVNNNINQLAKHANQFYKVADLNPNVFAQFNLLMTRYLDTQDEMNRLLKKIYKTIS